MGVQAVWTRKRKELYGRVKIVYNKEKWRQERSGE
jgi:hypothetical protein